jgi:hypothetical protein
VAIRHPGQIPRCGMRAGIQNDLISASLLDSGFRATPYRVRGKHAALARNDSFVELLLRLLRGRRVSIQKLRSHS